MGHADDQRVAVGLVRGEPGEGATIGIIDTGVDFTHPDIAPNLDLGLSCSFITPTNPAAIPEDIDPTGACLTKSATQDFFGHGPHVAGIAAAPINGLGVAGVAPEATLVCRIPES
jgi:lantibiotic leader peptide-processing serine protease